MSCCLLLTFGPRLRRLHGALLGSEYSALPEDGGGERGCEERGVESQPCCMSGRRQLVSSFPLPLLHSAAVRLGLTGSERTPLPPHVTPLCECGTFRVWNAGCNLSMSCPFLSRRDETSSRRSVCCSPTRCSSVFRSRFASSPPCY